MVSNSPEKIRLQLREKNQIGSINDFLCYQQMRVKKYQSVKAAWIEELDVDKIILSLKYMGYKSAKG